MSFAHPHAAWEAPVAKRQRIIFVLGPPIVGAALVPIFWVLVAPANAICTIKGRTRAVAFHVRATYWNMYNRHLKYLPTYLSRLPTNAAVPPTKNLGSLDSYCEK